MQTESVPLAEQIAMMKRRVEGWERLQTDHPEDAGEFTAQRLDLYRAILVTLEQHERAMAAVKQQTNDEGLWFDARTAPEAYLQQELRKLHAAIEDGTTTLDAAQEDDRE